MKYYYNGTLLFVDMVTPYRYAVLEGDRVITCRQTREQAESAAFRQRQYRKNIIAQFDRALNVDEIRRIGQTPDRLTREIREDYPTAAAIYAAIQRQRRTLNSIRVVELEAEP